MKLYATTTSERASKGQGGQFLNIVIYDDQKQEIARFVATQEENGYVIAYDYDEDSTIVERWHELELATTKGNKQKGECNGKHENVNAIIKCADCSKALDSM